MKPATTAVWMMLLASLLFALMGVCVKLASSHYAAGEIVFYRGLVGMLVMGAVTRLQGGTLRTAHPMSHLGRSASGVVALCMWFYAIGQLPLATAVTLNYTASVWMALFIAGSAALRRTERVDPRLLLAVAVGFAGVALILRPTLDQSQVAAGVVGLLSGMLSASAYLQVAGLGRLGEPEVRVVFYFSLGSLVAGAATMAVNGASPHTAQGLLALLGVGCLATAAQWAMTRAYAFGGSLVNASLQYLGIVYSFVFGVLIFHDPVTPMALAGMALVVGAGLLATRLRHSPMEPAPTPPALASTTARDAPPPPTA